MDHLYGTIVREVVEAKIYKKINQKDVSMTEPIMDPVNPNNPTNPTNPTNSTNPTNLSSSGAAGARLGSCYTRHLD